MKRIAPVLISLLATVTVVVGGAILFPEPLARQFVLPMIEAATGYSITAERLSLSWDKGIKADKITLADPSGVWLTIDRPVVVPRWLTLTGDRPHFQRIEAARAVMHRMPLTTSLSTDEPWQAPDIPLVTIDALAVERIDLPKAVVGTDLSFEATGGRTVEGDRVVSELSLISLGAVRFSLTGRANNDRNGGTIDLQYAEGGDGPINNRMAQETAKTILVTLKGTGKKGRWKGSYAATIDEVKGIEGSFTLANDGLRRLGVEARLYPAAFDPRFETGTVELMAAHLQAAADFSKVTLDELNVAMPEGELRGHGYVDLKNRNLKGTFHLVTDSASRLDRRLSGRLTGSLKLDGALMAPTGKGEMRWEQGSVPGGGFALLRIRGEGNPVANGVRLNLSFNVDDPDFKGIAQGEGPISGKGNILLAGDGSVSVESFVATHQERVVSLSGRRTPDGDMKGELRIAIAESFLEGGIAYDRGKARGTFNFNVDTAEPVAIETAGVATITVKQSGDEIVFRGNLDAPAGKIDGEPFTKLSFAVAGKGKDRFTGKGGLSVTRGVTPASASFSFHSGPENAFALQGEGKIRESRFSFNGDGDAMEGSFVSRNIRDLGNFLNLPVGGGLEATGSWREKRLALNAKGSDLWYDDIAIKTFSGSCDLIFRQGRPVGDFASEATHVATTDMVLTSANITGRFDDRGVGRFTSTLEGFRNAPFTLNVGGGVSFLENEGEGGIDLFSGVMGELPLSLHRPITGGWNGEGSRLSGAIGLGEGVIDIVGETKGEKVAMTVHGDRLPLQLLSRFDLLAVTGEADLRLGVGGTVDAPLVEASLTSSNITPINQTTLDLTVLSLVAKASYGKGTLTSSVKLSGGTSDFAFEGDAPVILSLFPFVAKLDERGKGRSTTTFDLNLDDLIGMAPRLSFGLSGRVKGAVDLAGPMDDPQAEGRVTLRQGGFALYDIGATLRGIEADLQAAEGRLTLTRFIAKDKGAGTYGMSGSILLSAVEDFPYRFTLIAHDAETISRTDLTAKAKGELTFDGDTNHLDIAGQLSMSEVAVTWEPSSAPDIPELTVVEENLDYAPKRRASLVRKEPFKLAYDIDLDLPGPARLEGPGIDSRWEGEMTVTGDADTTRVDGELRLTRGRFDLFGRPLTLSGGRAVFLGETPINPSLDFHAVSKSADLRIDVFLNGTAYHPEITATSSPALPESEVMSALLFGRTLSGVTPLQGVQVAQALRVLSGSSGGGGGLAELLKRSRTLLNLADLRLIQDTNNPSEYGIGVGAYIGSGAYVEAEQSLAGRGAKVTVEVEVTDHVTLDTQVGEDAQSGVGVNWKKDY